MQEFQQLKEQSKKIDIILILGMFPLESHVVHGVGTVAIKIIVALQKIAFAFLWACKYLFSWL